MIDPEEAGAQASGVGDIDASVNELPPLEHAGSEDDEVEQRNLRKAKKAKKKARGPHDVAEELNIVALMDAFTIILVYLIKSYSSDPANITQSAELTLPASQTLLSIVEATPLVITSKAILVNNKAVARMTDKGVDPTEMGNSMTITHVLEALKKEADGQKMISRYNAKVKFEGLLLVVADRKTTFQTLTEVLYTAGQAEFGQYKFAVLKKD